MKKLYSIFLVSLLSVMFAFAAPTTGLQFSGAATSFIDLGPQAAFSSQQFTIEAWVNYQSLSGAYVISNEGWTKATGSEGFSLRTSGSKIEFVLGANTEWPSLKSNTDIQLDTWYHIAATYSGTEMKLYINGVLDASVSITNPMILSTQGVSIGEGSMWKGRLLNGKLSDLRFWNVVRTDAEIAANMSSSLTGKEAGLVANWKMNEGANSTTVADATGNYNITKPADVTWFGTSTGVKAINDNSLDIQTSVFGSMIQVINNTNSKLKLAVYSMTGQKVMEGSLSAGSTYEKEAANIKGTFILKCVAENGAVSTKKFILAK